jgi:hypothetical protein
LYARIAPSDTRTAGEWSSSLAGSTFEGISVIGFKGSQAGFEQLSPRHDDDIEAGCDLVTTENLSYESFGAISPDSVTELLRGRDPQPPDALIIGQDEDRAVSTVNPYALTVDLFEVRAAADPLVGPQACRRTVHPLFPP